MDRTGHSPDSPFDALGPLDGRYRKAVEALAPYFSEAALVRYRIRVEVRWLAALAENRQLPEAAAIKGADLDRLEALFEQFTPSDFAQIKEIESKINHDVKAVEYFIKDHLKDHRLGGSAEMVHFGCTSEDVNNLAYALMIRDAVEKILIPLLESLQGDLTALAVKYRDLPMLARTHGQPATPTTLGKEMANFAARLDRPIDLLRRFPYRGKMNGATGNYSAHFAAYPQVDWPDLSDQFLRGLGLEPNFMTTQIEPHDWMAELFDLIKRSNTIALDISRDFWLYIMNQAFRQRAVMGEVGSSTMPHKINPIDFENAEGNLGIANALLAHLSEKLPISRLQRDLSDSTALRNVGVAFGHSLLAWRSLRRGLSKVEADEEHLRAELENNWEVLAEAVQTLMRKYGVSRPYEHLKELTRGKRIDAPTLHAFIDKLRIPGKEKSRMLKWTPSRYVGLAARLVDRYLEASQGIAPAKTGEKTLPQPAQESRRVNPVVEDHRAGEPKGADSRRAIAKREGQPQKVKSHSRRQRRRPKPRKNPSGGENSPEKP